MALIDALGLRADAFARVFNDEPIPEGDAILPLARLAAEGGAICSRGFRLGVHLPNTTKPDEIAEFLHRLSLISIDFPSFGDGRGFSIARQLRRTRCVGRLRAAGPLIADQMRHAFGCGFDEIEMPDDLLARQPLAQWLSAASMITLRYQRDGGRGVSILDRRHAARQAQAKTRVANAA